MTHKDTALPSHNQELTTSEQCFSFFDPPITNTRARSKPATIHEIYEIIRGSSLKPITEYLRDQQQDQEERKKKKRQLPCVTFSGIFSERKTEKLVQRSEYFCCDLDHIGLDQEEIKSNIKRLFVPILMFRSPSGDGLKVVFKIKTKDGEHGEYGEALQNFFMSELGEYFKNTSARFDPNAKKITSSCFLCHDPEVFYSDEPAALDRAFIDTFILPDEDKSTPLLGQPFKPDVQANTLTPEEIYKSAKAWCNKKLTFCEGSRNRYTSELVGYLHRVGVDEENALILTRDLEEPGFTTEEISSIVTSIYKNTAYKGIAPLTAQWRYISFPIRLLYVSTDQLPSQIEKILKGDFKWEEKDIPTSLKEDYLKDAISGKIERQLFLMLAAFRSIIGRKNFTLTNWGFVRKRMYGKTPYEHITDYRLRQLANLGMERKIFTRLAPGRGFRGFYISIRYKPQELAENIAKRIEKITKERTQKQLELEMAEDQVALAFQGLKNASKKITKGHRLIVV